MKKYIYQKIRNVLQSNKFLVKEQLILLTNEWKNEWKLQELQEIALKYV